MECETAKGGDVLAHMVVAVVFEVELWIGVKPPMNPVSKGFIVEHMKYNAQWNVPQGIFTHIIVLKAIAGDE